MNPAFAPLRKTLWNVLRQYGALSRSPQPFFGQTTCCRKLQISPSTHGGQIHRLTNCSVSSARFLSSVSPEDIRSPLPDVDIPVVNFAEFVFKHLDQFKDNPALSDGVTGRKYTYQDLKKYAIRVASALHRQGYRKGDVISTFTINLPEFCVLSVAAACLGLVIAPANPAYKAAELSHMLTHSRSIAVFTIPQLLTVVQEAIKDPDLPHNVKAVYTFGHAVQGARFFNDLMEDDGKAFPENVDIDPVQDILVLPYSSGTTGLPKGVMLSHHNLVANVLQARDIMAITPEDRTLGVLPFFHIYGFSIIQWGTFCTGAHMVTLPRFEPGLYLDTIQKQKISVLHTVPPMVLLLAKHPMVADVDFSSVKYILCGAAPLGGPVTEECQDRLGIPLYQAYGMTETSPLINVDASPGHPGTIGHLLPNTRAKLVNAETGEPVGVGEMGEYCVKGPQVMLGYYHNQKATDDMIDPDGWLHTGDLGHMREDGMVVIEDRLKELIKYKGFQVPPAELESLLLTHPAVQDVGVIGIPDEEAGELPRAYVVLKPNRDISAKDICDFVEKIVSPPKRLRGGVEFVEEIPKTPSGKILRRVLKTRALQTD